MENISEYISPLDDKMHSNNKEFKLFLSFLFS